MDVVVEHLKSSANSVNPNYFLPHHHHQTSQMPFMDGCSHHETSFMHASQGFLPSMASSYQSSFGTTSSSSPSYPSSSTSTSAYNSYCWMQRASSDYISPTGSSASSSTTMMMMPFYHHHPPSSVSPSVSNHSTSPERINKYHASEQYSNYATMNSMPHYYPSDHVYHHNHQSYESEVTPQTPGDQENNFETDNCLKRSSPESKKRVCRINGRKKVMPISETLSEPASSEKTTPPRKIERKRTVSINTAFASLRGRIPNVPNDTKLSKIKTLRLATAYISFLMQKLAEDPDDSAVSATEATTTPFGLEGFKVDLSRCKRSRNNTSLSAFLMTSSSSSCASANTTVLPSTSRRSRRVNKEAFTDLSHESITSYRLRAVSLSCE